MIAFPMRPHLRWFALLVLQLRPRAPPAVPQGPRQGGAHQPLQVTLCFFPLCLLVWLASLSFQRAKLRWDGCLLACYWPALGGVLTVEWGAVRRFLVFLRLLVMLGFFFWRITNPNNKAFGLWMTAVICEIWIGLAWIVDQAPRLGPVNRETFMDRLMQK